MLCNRRVKLFGNIVQKFHIIDNHDGSPRNEYTGSLLYVRERQAHEYIPVTNSSRSISFSFILRVLCTIDCFILSALRTAADDETLTIVEKRIVLYRQLLLPTEALKENNSLRALAREINYSFTAQRRRTL